MSWELYLAFATATAILIVIPGPSVTLIVANSLGHGERAGLVTVAGNEIALALQIGLVALGITSLMAVLAEWFEALRWLGVAYLVWIGIQRWRADASLAPAEAVPASSRRLFWQGFLVAATNPKVLFFHVAFFPQFIDPTIPLAPQFALLCPTFVLIAAVIDGGYALAAGRARRWFSSRRRARLANRLTGSLLVGAGVWLALARRS